MEKRYQFLDVARGIAILLVILGHSCNPSRILLNEILLSFHMPLFLFLSGMMAKRMTKDNIVNGILKKTKKLLIPQCTMATITSLYSICYSFVYVGDKKIEVWEILSNYLFWFLPVLLLCSIIQALISLFTENFFKANCISFTLGAILVLPSMCLIDFTESMDINILMRFLIRIVCIVPTALLFYSMGSLLKDIALNIVCNHKHSNRTGLLNIFLICTLIVMASYNGFVFMYMNDYGHNYILFFLCSLIGIYLTLKISTLLESSIFLQTAGKYSICFYVWNFAACSFAKNLGNLLCHYIDIPFTVKSILNYGVAVLIIYVMTRITKNRFSFLYGLQ